MKLRDLIKAIGPNDGTRTISESLLSPEVDQAFKDWAAGGGMGNGVLIGGAALSFYVKPRFTQDADVLFMSVEDIPTAVEGFKRSRPGAFMHTTTHVEIEVLSPASIKMSSELARSIKTTAHHVEGILVASPAGLVAAKLDRFSRQDQADIEQLWLFTSIDLTPFPLSSVQLDRYNSLEQQLRAEHQ